MKQHLLLALAFACVACGGSEKTEEANTTAEPIAEEAAQPEVQHPGLELIANSDCVACHKIDEKVIGPAYTEVAERYHGNDTAVAYLAKKIIQGGAGNWGTVPMTPHPQLSQQDAEQMASYVMSLHN